VEFFVAVSSIIRDARQLLLHLEILNFNQLLSVPVLKCPLLPVPAVVTLRAQPTGLSVTPASPM
jgi:hypothetical protein